MASPPRLKLIPLNASQATVKINTIVDVTTDNAETYYEVKNQLEALQQWIRNYNAIINKEDK